MNALVASSKFRNQHVPACYYEDEATGMSSEEEFCDYDDVEPPAPSSNRKWELCKLTYCLKLFFINGSPS